MPCYDGTGPGGTSYYEDPLTKRRLDVATRVACTVLRKMNPEQLRSLDPETQRWWASHQAEDKKREAREQAQRERLVLKEKALSKLTPAERKALGI
jgi:hypothetical protein